MSTDTTSSMNVFVSRGLQKLQKLASGKKFTTIREVCQSCLEQIESEEKAAAVRGTPAPSQTDVADKYFTPFKLACESKTSKIVEFSLDCLQKMITFGYLVGNSPAEDDPSKPLIDLVIQTICGCVDLPEDSVHLLILKTLIAAVTSKTCAVHSSSLLLAVRTCYNIHVISKNASNQTTAKGGLTQMLNIIFSRMESSAATDAVVPPTITVDSGAGTSSDATLSTEIGKDKAAVDSAPVRSPSTASLSEGAPEDPTTEAAQTSTVMSDDNNSVYGASSITQSRVSMESTRTAGTTTAFHDDFGGDGEGIFTDVRQNDAFLLFRALCKLSMKPLPDGISADSLDMRRRILSLELLLCVLENSGPIFQNSEKFISAIKQYLCLSLLKNCVSTVPTILKLSLTIFSCLILNFREHLKNEIGVFFTNVFLRILESSNSNLQQKFIVAQVLHTLCQDPQALVDIFVNYDCDLQALNIFESVVNDLANIVKGSHDSSWIATSPETPLRLISLESLVQILRSMVQWATDRQPKSPSSSNLAEIAAGSQPPPYAHSRSGSIIGGGMDDDRDEHFLASSHSNISSSFSMELAQANAADLVEKRKLMKLDLEKAISKFNLKPKKGIQYLLKCNLVENTPHDVSQFLRFTEGLNKTAVGEYMGEPDDFNKQVLYAYVDSMDYTGLDFDEALRFFLAGFRIPGEAQKIDRMVEKFAERYITCNPGVFASADTPYKLAYSIIMLNTDAHNPRVKHKMTKHEFLRNNRGIDDGQDLPAEYLSDLYDRIVACEIKLKDDEESYDSMEKNSLLSNPKRRQLAFVAESQQMVKKTKEIFQSKKDAASTFLKAIHVEHIRPMFGCCWPPMIAAYSTLLEATDDPTVSKLCLDGLENGIHIASTFYMEAERGAFITTLIKFTNLGTGREMKLKNIECVKGVIRVAHKDGNYLQSSWGEILRSISEIERLYLRGLGAKPDSAFLQPSPQDGFLKGAKQQINQMMKKRASIQITPDQLAQIEEMNSASVAATVDQSEIDRLFSSSGELSNDSIVDFVKYLCLVSKDEIESPEPRMFSLQKLVEVAAFNMSRIRLVWSDIWAHMADHFTSVGCNKNLTLAMYAIDSLRQLAMKFLAKDEFSNFHFQRDFLKPFDVICNATASLKIRELVLCCLAQMVQSRAKNIKSGWKSIFSTFTIAAGDSHDNIVKLAFENTEKIIKEHFSLIVDTFVDCVNALLAFASNSVNTKISLQSLDFLRICTHRLVDGQISSLGIPKGNNGGSTTSTAVAVAVTTTSTQGSTPVYTDDKSHLRVWFPILTGLSRLVGDSRLDMRLRSLEVLFDILESYGSLFSRSLWELVFRGVLLPIFDDVRQESEPAGTQKEESEWITTTCMKAMSILVELFSHFYSTVDFLFPEVLSLLAACIKRGGNMLSKIGVICLVQLFLSTGEKFSPETWAQICSSFEELFIFTDPTPEILQSSNQNAADSNSQLQVFNSQAVDLKLSTQLSLVGALNDIVVGSCDFLAVSHVQSLIGCFERAFRSVRKIGEADDLRASLRQAGHDGILDSVLKLEIQSATAYLRSLVSMFTDTREERSVRRDVCEGPVIGFCVELLGLFIDRSKGVADSTLPSNLSESQCLVPVVVSVLNSMMAFSDTQFAKYAPDFYNIITDLIVVDSKEVRIAARDVFVRIGRSTRFARQ